MDRLGRFILLLAGAELAGEIIGYVMFRLTDRKATP